ncbi:DUF1343 domain-containing protein [Acetoanaerobium pronyense]|uniref:DUF1343 domain-containing protein n=1 Tax=Acetoanaerobium pronyense TaxID=1482736 RepID=UPI001AE30AE2|nr:DUF1343 domain-containing protein [Acetoanaerobium pronyense]
MIYSLGVIKIKRIIALLTISLIGFSSISFASSYEGSEYFGTLRAFLNAKALETTIAEDLPLKDSNTSKDDIPLYSTVLGNERLLTEYSHLIDGKRVGLITNHTGVNSKLERTVDILYRYNGANLTSIYSPEHGLDGKAVAGAYVDSYTDTTLNLPVYSLYGKTRKPSPQMLSNVDVLIFDMQDIGSRTYTYMSTLNYAMIAAKENGKTIVVLDRPNPVGGLNVEGYVLEDKYKTFVGVDNMPMAHGMTAGELALFFNRNIGADVKIVPMKNYSRNMIWQDTGLPFVQTSPNIPNIESAFAYMATGIGDGTGMGQGDKFTWVGGKGYDSNALANALNAHNLPGIVFIPEVKGDRGGVKLSVTDYHAFNPALTGVYILSTANLQKPLTVPIEKNGVIPMFEKNMGGARFGKDLLNKRTGDQIVASYQAEVQRFKELRKNYLIYD